METLRLGRLHFCMCRAMRPSSLARHPSPPDVTTPYASPYARAVLRPMYGMKIREDDAEATTHFVIFATRALEQGEESVVGWEWDDAIAVHRVGEVAGFDGCVFFIICFLLPFHHTSIFFLSSTTFVINPISFFLLSSATHLPSPQSLHGLPSSYFLVALD
ncbi:hypothetical protein MVEN_02380900 [Mycena venus]|uniref:Uncharacterized protein n=1 Tax=Mycena venus TaxID=2733690 RepID=A0A8H6X2E2_9AGAR|nr:hypothetical protein MVEN_02380900 [Mycena venus]